jgi:hypothetical protein
VFLYVAKAMFWIYTAGEFVSEYDTLPGVNQLLDPAATGATKDRAPLIAKLGSLGSSSESDMTVSMFVRDSSIVLATQYVNETTLITQSSGLYALPDEHASWIVPEDVTKLVAFVDDNQAFSIILVASSGKVIIGHLSVDSVGHTKNMWADWQQLTVDIESTIVDASHISARSNGGNEFAFVAVNDKKFELYSVIIEGVCPSATSRIGGSKSVSSSLSRRDDVVKVRLATVSGAQLLFYSSAKENAVYGALLSDTDLKFTTDPQWVRVSTGLDFDVAWISVAFSSSLGADTKSDALMLVADHGYCYNSHTHNTRSFPTVCDSGPTVVTPYTMDYSFGLLNDWKSLLRTSECVTNKNDCFAVTVCNERVLHGSYDQGSKPAVTMISLPGGAPLFVEVHEGLSESVTVDAGCGEPYRRESIVIDAFSPVSWMNNLLRTST